MIREPFFADYAERLGALHAGLSAAIAELPLQALDWTPGPEMNSLGVLVAHTAGSERFWIGDIAAQRPSGRVRAREFEVEGRDAAALQALMDRALAFAEEVLAGLALADLAAERETPDGRIVTVGWALLHALEHTAQHMGHCQLTRQLWEEKTGAAVDG